MKNNTERKTINVDNPNLIPLWAFKEDDDVVLNLSLYKESVPFNITGQKIRLGAKTSQGLKEQIDGFTIQSNNLDIVLKNTILVRGLVEIDLEFTDVGGKMTSTSFFVNVNSKVLNDRAVEATNEFDTFKKTVEEITTDYKGLRRIVIDENNAADLQDQVNKTNSQLEQIETQKASKVEIEIERKRIDNFTSLAEGSTTGDAELLDGRVGADGVTYSNLGNAIRNQFLENRDDINEIFYNAKKGFYTLLENKSIEVTDGINKVTDSTGKYLYLVDKDVDFLTISCGEAFQYNHIYWLDSSFKVLGTKNLTTLGSKDILNINPGYDYKYRAVVFLKKVELKIYAYGESYDNGLKSKSMNYPKNIFNEKGKNLANEWNCFPVEFKQIYESGNYPIYQLLNNNYKSIVIPFEKTIFYTNYIQQGTGTTTILKPFGAILDVDMKYIDYFDIKKTTFDFTSYTNENAKYLVFSYYYNDIFDINNIVISKIPKTKICSDKMLSPRYYDISKAIRWYNNKKICFFGDSITEQDRYTKHIKEYFGCDYVLNAKGGSTIAKYDSNGRTDYMCGETRINAIPADCDVVVIAGGTNDVGYSTIGTLGDGNLSEYGFKNAYSLMLKRIRTRLPNALIICCTPLGGMQIGSGDKDVQYKNSLGETHRDYSKAIIDVCNYYCIPCIDVNAESGVNVLNRSIYIEDDVHPNYAGAKKLAVAIINGMLRFEPMELKDLV